VRLVARPSGRVLNGVKPREEHGMKRLDRRQQPGGVPRRQRANRPAV